MEILIKSLLIFQGMQRQVTLETVDDYIVGSGEGKGPFMCAMCHVHMKQRINVRTHIKAVHLNVRNHRCSFCNAAFAKKCNRIAHEKKCKSKQNGS